MIVLNFEPFPILQTERLVLRKVTLVDAPEVFIQRSHPEIQKYIKRQPALSIDDAEQFIEKITTQEKNQESITWAITLKAEPKLIGSICLWKIEKENEKAEVGYSLHPDHFAKGIMSEALTQVCKFGFETMKLKCIDAYTNKENKSSLRLLNRNGFKRNVPFENESVSKEELEYNVVYTLLSNSFFN